MSRPGRTRSLPRARAALIAVLAMPVALAACGGEEEVGAKPDLPTETPALWNPCDSLDTAFIRKQFGARTEERNGTATQPDCRFAPEEESGDPVVTVNYQLFDGDLEQLWETMGGDDGAEVTRPDIAGADDARIVVDAVKKQLYVTGFVETGDLFQVVNVADPAPYGRAAVVAGVEATLTALAAQADEAGIG